MYTVRKDPRVCGRWRVERFQADGKPDNEVVLFVGREAENRAHDYVAMQGLVDEDDRQLEELLQFGGDAPVPVRVARRVSKHSEAVRGALLHARARITELETKQIPALLRALANVRALATRAKRYDWRPTDVDHLLRFCAEVGVVGSLLRHPAP